eukprot:UN03100
MHPVNYPKGTEIKKPTGKLFIGDLGGAMNNKKCLENNDIKTVISVINKTFTETKGVTYHKISISDDPSQNLKVHFDKTNKLIDDSLMGSKNVLVHCNAGVSRSATVVISYLCFKFSLTPSEGLKLLRETRAVCMPNEGFF